MMNVAAGLLGLRRRDPGDFGPSGLAARILTYTEESNGGGS